MGGEENDHEEEEGCMCEGRMVRSGKMSRGGRVMGAERFLQGGGLMVGGKIVRQSGISSGWNGWTVMVCVVTARLTADAQEDGVRNCVEDCGG